MSFAERAADKDVRRVDPAQLRGDFHSEPVGSTLSGEKLRTEYGPQPQLLAAPATPTAPAPTKRAATPAAAKR